MSKDDKPCPQSANEEALRLREALQRELEIAERRYLEWKQYQNDVDRLRGVLGVEEGADSE